MHSQLTLYKIAPTTQFQCDEGASPTNGFSVNSQGQIQYNGNTQFYACETGQNGGSNIYTETNENDQTGCRPVNLSADSCSSSGGGGGSSPSSSPSPVSSPASSASPSPRPSGSSSSGAGAGGSSPSSSSSIGGGAWTPSSSMSTPVSSTSQVIPVSSAPGSSPSQVTVWTTMTTSVCNSESSVPSVPVQTPSGPVGGGSGPSATPSSSGPMGGGAGPSGTPSSSGPMGGGSGPSATPSSSGPVGGGSGPSSTPSQSSPGGGSSPQPSGTSSASQPSGTPPMSGGGSGNSCPTNLNGEYQAPHLIIPVDSSSPDEAPGTSYNGTISSTLTTLYNFDIPQSYADKTCSLVFLFPELQDLETSSWTFSGDGKIDFASLQSPVTTETSYNSAPAVDEDYGVTTVSPGNSYVISTFSCPAGEAVSYEMKNAGSTYLDFFEDYNPSP